MKVNPFHSLIVIAAALALSSCASKPSVKVVEPLVNFLENPSAVQTASPTFSWKIVSRKQAVSQSSYRIIVSSSKKLLDGNAGDLWDSGEVESDATAYVRYDGEPLASGQKAWWKVLSVTNVGECESEAGFWRAGLEEASWKAQWIGRDYEDDDLQSLHTKVNARYLRKEFRLSGKPKSAVLYICGLGLYEAYLNEGNIAPDQVLSPILSSYDKSVYYNAFEVGKSLRKGTNTLGVILGNGRYVSMRSHQASIPEIRHFGTPRLLLQLDVTYSDGTKESIVSDETWKITNEGPIRTNNEYDGELYDSSREMPHWTKSGYDDSAWDEAAKVEAPGGKLLAQPTSNSKIQDRLHPVDITSRNGKYYVDLGQNMVGWLDIHAFAAAGDTVVIRYSETMNPDTTLYVANLRDAEVTDCYVQNASGPFHWHPTFVYHGFRYAELSGLSKPLKASDIEGQVLYDEMKCTGHFETSNEVINAVHRSAYWGIRGNYHGMPTDCPQRDERMGWLGDRTTGCWGESYLFDNHLLYAKWMDDIVDAQMDGGALPNVVPTFYRIISDNLTWPAAFIYVADMLYQNFGDPEPILKCYPSMRKWLTYMRETYYRDGLITKDTFGDWCMPPESLELIRSKDPSRITDGSLLSTAFYIRLCRLMSRFALLSGELEDVDYFNAEATSSTEAFNKTFYNAEKGYYSNNTVTANLLPLFFGLVPAREQQRVMENIASKTEGEFGGHVSTGVIGIQELMRGLTDYGRPDLAVKLATNTTYPSWGYMVEQGATTIWELWNGNTADPAMNSRNHVMLLGDLLLWDYSYLGGISPYEPGYKVVKLKPYPLEGLDRVDCSYESIYGEIRSAWCKDEGEFLWSFTIPANTSARVYLPGTVDSTELIDLGAEYLGSEEGREVYLFPSGSYSVESTL